MHTVLALSVSKGSVLHQLDVSNSFLHGNLEEDIYMTQSQGFVNEEYPNYVCKLRKSL